MLTDATPRLDLPPILRSHLFERYYLVSANTSRRPLRVGVMLDSEKTIAFFAAILEQIARSNHSRIVACVLNGSPQPPAPAGKLQNRLRLLRDPRLRRRLAWILYHRWDQKRHPEASALFETVDCSQLLETAERITAIPLVSGFTHRFDAATLERLRRLDLDVVLRFGFAIIRGEILQVARYGIWSYHHGDNRYYRGAPPQFWELYEGNPCVGAILQVLNEELDGGLVLDRIVASTEPGISVARNRLGPYLGSLHLVIRALHDLHEFGWEYLLRRAPAPAPYQGRRRIYRTPTNREVVNFFVRGAARAALARLRGSFRCRCWSIGFRHLKAGSGQPLPASAEEFRWWEPPEEFFYADPFVVRHGGRSWLFFERFVRRRRRGHIACVELRPEGPVGEVTVVLEEPWHLSYPMVFSDSGEYFMIPESAASGKVTLYRAADFPYRWVRERDLFDFGLRDVTPFYDGERYWFFAAARDPRGACEQLCLFHAPGLFAAWQWHPANPVCSDVHRARPAGAVFRLGPRLIRPAQDGAGGYGRAVRFLEIRELTPSSYAEVEVAVLRPPEGADGLHTFNSDGVFDVTDRLRTAWRRSFG